ncbi:MAG: hypothetical protein GVX78_01550, partial [Bacteroidetes bacterium]|nr:hypothetical protein [Bacteroidota bacterium]
DNLNFGKQLLTACCLILLTIPAKEACSQEIHILNAKETAYYSTHDTIDNFFNRIQPLEVSIQLKDSSIMHLSQSRAAEKLRNRMKTQGVQPNSEQLNILHAGMKKALKLSRPCLRHYPLPDTIRVGIIKGDLYGPSVFYTRENGIYVPEPMVKEENKKMLITVLIHEIFHIQSRTHPKLQEKLYAHLGFRKLKQEIEYPKNFIARTLLNPDGTDWDYYIPLSMKGDEVAAFPLIVSSKPSFKKDSPNFFSYLKFQLYALQDKSGAYQLSFDDNLNGLKSKWMQPFFEQITDNTDYIIHPDELMADNFVLLTRWIENKTPPERISEEGKVLLQNLAGEYQVSLP